MIPNTLEYDPLDLLKCDLIVAAVVELGGALVERHLPCVGSRLSVLPGRARERKSAEGVLVTGLQVERVALGRPSWRNPMATNVQKITLSGSRDIPFNKLVLSQSNDDDEAAGEELSGEEAIRENDGAYAPEVLAAE